MGTTDPFVGVVGSASLLLATAFTLAFVTLMSAPGILASAWKVVKAASVVSTVMHLVATTWPAAPAHPWARIAVGLAEELSGRIQAGTVDACRAGVRWLLPVLVG